MSFFLRLVQSWRKSRRLRELQLKISPPGQTITGLAEGLKARIESGDDSKNRALEQFLDLCEPDEGVSQVMERYNFARQNLKERYVAMRAGGLGRWVKGHFVALSTIAYVEPLLYLAEAERRGQSRNETYIQLLQYWEGRVPQGALLGSLKWTFDRTMRCAV